MKRHHSNPLLPFLAVAATLLCAAQAQAQPIFSKAFSPNTIGQGGTSTLTFTITEASGRPTPGLAFVDNMPVAITVASPANIQIGGDCRDIEFTAAEGSSLVTLTNGGVGGGQTCTLSVDVTSSIIGTHTNLTGDLTSSSGNSGTATDDLVVTDSTPGFSKSFAPTMVGLGGRSTLTFTIDNSSNANSASSLRFTDTLPAGMVVANPANASTDCIDSPFTGGALTATPGTSLIQTSSLGGLSSYAVAAGANCTVRVDVTANSLGSLLNQSGALEGQSSFTFFSTGPATATLDVVASTQLILSKAFTDDPVLPGATGTLEFTVRNRSRGDTATDIAFTDDLDAALTGLVATGLPLSNVCGAGSTLSGTSLLTLTGGTLSAGADCTFSVSVAVPGGAAPGAYPNTTSSLTANLGGSPVTGDPAGDTLFVSAVPVLSKSFTPSTVVPGDSVTLEFTIDNPSSTSAMTDIAFEDDLDSFVASGLPGNPCGAGSLLFTTTVSPGRLGLSLTNGTLSPGASCTFSVTIGIPLDTPTNSYVNTTEPITATIDAASVTGQPATDTLSVVAAPQLSKSFTGGAAVPGGTATLEFRLTNSENAPTAATGISFTDDLATMLTGLTASLPSSPDPPCGAGSSLVGSAGDTLLTLMGGTLNADEECVFTVTLNIPAGASSGTFANTTSAVSATVGGLAVLSSPASANLAVGGVQLTKEFIDDPALPGDTVTLQFTLDNNHPSDNVTGVFFTDSLSATLTGLTTSGSLPATPCGAGSSISGTTSLTFSGGDLLAGETCTFDVPLLVPAGAADGQYGNVTSTVIGTLGGSVQVFPAASDTLSIDGNRLLLSKEFTDDPVAPGDNVFLEFTVTNSDTSNAAANVSFSDDLDATLSGLVASSIDNDGCSSTPTGIGGGFVTFSNISVAAGASCTLRLVVAVPGSATAGSYPNTTSTVTGDIGGLPVDGAAATDTLVVDEIRFTMSFLGPIIAGQTGTLRYEIANLGATTRSGLQFINDLGGIFAGVTATSTPQTNPCGLGSSLTGSGLLTLSGGNVAPMGTCTIDVTVQIPAATPISRRTNTTTALREGGNTVADPATAELIIQGEVTNTATVTADGAAPVNPATTDVIDP